MDSCALGDLLDAVGGSSVRLHTAPAGLAVPVTGTLLYDAHAPFPRVPGALLLAVGVPGAAAGPLVRAAAEAGMSGLVVRGPDGPLAEAESAGLALLSVDGDTAWHQVHLLPASAIGALSHPLGRARAGGTSLPMAASGAVLGDLFALADAVAAAVGGATAVEEPRQRILAYSTRAGAVGRRGPPARHPRPPGRPRCPSSDTSRKVAIRLWGQLSPGAAAGWPRSPSPDTGEQVTHW
ncbi:MULTISPECIES: hypothetical protein [unclassified Streptomyces]|uniref:hypothetical protein n=1 Tax=unclassified Streptomyces TaxID=2593676 RepID=UPI0033DC6410